MRKTPSRVRLGEPETFVKFDSEDAAGALEAFRINYASYRLGAVRGAKGEIGATSERGVDVCDRESRLREELKKVKQALLRAESKVVELRQTTRDLEAVRLSYASSDESLSLEQRQARSFLRGELVSRFERRSARVTAGVADVLGKCGRGDIACSRYEFTTGAPVRTEVLVARGVVARVEQASFEIIPLSSASSPLFIFTDATVDALYGDRFVAGFERLGYVTHKVVIPDGEDAKTLEVFAALADKVLSIGIDKHSVLISLGGGAVANVCGFIASTLHRGIGLIHFPTTLLAQCDAAISHKQAVNAPHGKNLVGSYYAPIRIIVDPDVLQTLEDWLLPDGMGEIVKHALCQDTQLLEMLDEFDGPLTDPDFLERVVRRTIELKCEVVLVYGHTLGHPIEAISHRPGSPCCLSHGQAVAIGCVIAARVAVAMGMCDCAVVARTIDLCAKYALPFQIPPDQSVDRIMEKLPFNKTWTKEGSAMALLESTGRLFNVDSEYLLPVQDAIIRQAVTASMAPIGTVILGAGSSGFLRRNRAITRNDLIAVADNQTPGSGWSKDSEVPHSC